jgi:hypothetical protein
MMSLPVRELVSIDGSSTTLKKLVELGDDSVEVRRRSRQTIELRHQERVTVPHELETRLELGPAGVGHVLT